MKIAAYAISRNEAAHVERFMIGVKDADVVIVADTGSTDDTVDRLRATRAIVHEVSVTPWRFDSARNIVLDLVPEDVDICFSLDLDEFPEPGWREAIETGWLPGVTRMFFDFIWGVNDDGTPKGIFKSTKLHARHGYRWRRAVHEILVPTGREQVANTNMRVWHFPDHKKSRSQYLPLLEIASREDPSDSQISFWLGREYIAVQRWNEAVHELERYLAIPSATWAPERAATLNCMATAWQGLDQPERAVECLRRACQEAPHERDPWVNLAQMCHDRGLWQEGLDAAERAMAITERPEHYLVSDDSWGERPSDLASVCAWNLGQHDRAREHVIAALALAPDDERIAANAAHMGVGNVQVVDPATLSAPPPSALQGDPDSPYLVSVTMTGNARDLIADAIASVVGWVDACLVVDTGVSDDTLDIARGIAGEKYHETAWAWNHDFAAARNAALDAATALGATWAVMLDTDERVIPGEGLDSLRDTLKAADAGMLLVEDVTGHYAKERLFRLPREGAYSGPVHEAFVVTSSRERLEGMRFVECAKTPEQYQAKFERDREILSRHVEEHPLDPRWHYYLGESLKNLGQPAAALAAYERCLELPGWDEQAAWAAFRAAECAIALSNHEAALELCARGLARHAGVAELAWLAGYASWQLGRPAQAAAWARMSIANGSFNGGGSVQERSGFRHPPGLFEGPFDVLRFALRALGDDEGADEAERMFEIALGARQAATGG